MNGWRSPYDAERHALLADLRSAFDTGTFEKAFPGSPAPLKVSIGGDSEDLAFEVVVWPMPESVSNVQRVAVPCSEMETTFEMRVGLAATGATHDDASSVVIDYINCFYQVCMADPTLKGLVDYARPSLEISKCGPDATWGYVAVAVMSVACRRHIKSNPTIARAVREAC